MLDLGSATARFYNTYESAWSVIDANLLRDGRIQGGHPMLSKDGGNNMPLLLQEELVDVKKQLFETEAGKALHATLHKLLAQQKETLKQLRDAAKEQNDPAAVADLEAKCMEVDEQLRQTLDEVQRMKIPLTRRLQSFFTFRRAKARALDSSNLD